MSEKLVTIVYEPKAKNARARKVVLGRYMDIGERRIVNAKLAKTLKSDKDIRIIDPEAEAKAAAKKAAAEKAAKEKAEKEAAEKSAKEKAEKEAAEKAAKDQAAK